MNSNHLINFLQAISFAGLGVFLLLREHYLAGGFCLLIASCSVVVYTSKKDDKEEDE